MPSISIAGASLESGIGAAELAVRAGLVASKGEASRLLKQGGLYVNDRRLQDERGQITMADAIGRSVIVLRKVSGNGASSRLKDSGAYLTSLGWYRMIVEACGADRSYISGSNTGQIARAGFGGRLSRSANIR